MTFYSTCREILSYLLGADPQQLARVPARRQYELLVISPDTRFFSSLVHIVAPYDWEVRWTRSVNGAINILADGSAPVVIYDWCPATEDWSRLIARLISLPETPCIILAAGQVDEALWHRAINQHVYDVVWRTGHSRHLLATLEFAWKWRTDRRLRGAGRLRGVASLGSNAIAFREREFPGPSGSLHM